MITRQAIVTRLEAYLRRDLSLEELVDWAENTMMESELAPEYHDAIRDALARLGVADVRAFGLTWEECEELLRSLGYRIHLEIAST